MRRAPTRRPPTPLSLPSASTGAVRPPRGPRTQRRRTTPGRPRRAPHGRAPPPGARRAARRARPRGPRRRAPCSARVAPRRDHPGGGHPRRRRSGRPRRRDPDRRRGEGGRPVRPSGSRPGRPHERAAAAEPGPHRHAHPAGDLTRPPALGGRQDRNAAGRRGRPRRRPLLARARRLRTGTGRVGPRRPGTPRRLAAAAAWLLVWAGAGIALAALGNQRPLVSVLGFTVSLGGLNQAALFFGIALVSLVAATILVWTTPVSAIPPLLRRLTGWAAAVRLPLANCCAAIALGLRMAPMLLDDSRTILHLVGQRRRSGPLRPRVLAGAAAPVHPRGVPRLCERGRTSRRDRRRRRRAGWDRVRRRARLTSRLARRAHRTRGGGGPHRRDVAVKAEPGAVARVRIGEGG